MSPLTRTGTRLSKVAYFSMEVGLDPDIPTYSGGLGVLAGDTLRAAADMGISMTGITLLYRKGYFNQHLDERGNQSESPSEWSPSQHLEPLPQRALVEIEGRHVQIRPWRYSIHGITGNEVPVYFLDTDLPDNDPRDRALTDYLYGGDTHYRLCQEVVLGMGGVAVLRVLGYKDMQTYHMNEGHSALLALALLEERTQRSGLRGMTAEDHEAVRRQCVFTTHTPVPSGHDKFPADMVRNVIGPERASGLEALGCFLDNELNMTHMGLISSRYINGVSMRHEEISRDMFPGYPINSVTNGVHAVTWTSEPFARLFDRHIPEWRRDNLNLRYAIGIPLEEIRQAHVEARKALIAAVEQRSGSKLDPAVFTIGFARRATGYKRADLLFADIERLKRIAADAGGVQLVYGGKAHPRDESGKELIRSIYEASAALKGAINVVYLENYDMALGKQMCSGVDLWLNTPQKPHEASGTSGMKAALNGVPSLSIQDGWWIEGLVEGVTGWGIGEGWEGECECSQEIASLYDKLEHSILPLFYGQPAGYAGVMRSAIALNGSFYNAERMVFQYLANAYSWQ